MSRRQTRRCRVPSARWSRARAPGAGAPRCPRFGCNHSPLAGTACQCPLRQRGRRLVVLVVHRRLVPACSGKSRSTAAMVSSATEAMMLEAWIEEAMWWMKKMRTPMPPNASTTRERDRQARDKSALVAAADGAQHNQAISENAGEDSEHDLRDAVAHEVPQDARRVLAGSQRQRHQGHGKRDAHHRHHRAGDRGQHPARARRAGAKHARPARQPIASLPAESTSIKATARSHADGDDQRGHKPKARPQIAPKPCELIHDSMFIADRWMLDLFPILVRDHFGFCSRSWTRSAGTTGNRFSPSFNGWTAVPVPR